MRRSGLGTVGLILLRQRPRQDSPSPKEDRSPRPATVPEIAESFFFPAPELLPQRHSPFCSDECEPDRHNTPPHAGPSPQPSGDTESRDLAVPYWHSSRRSQP